MVIPARVPSEEFRGGTPSVRCAPIPHHPYWHNLHHLDARCTCARVKAGTKLDVLVFDNPPQSPVRGTSNSPLKRRKGGMITR